MTRLTSQDISDVSSTLLSYDRDLRRKTGLNLLQLGCRAAGLPWAEAARLVPEYPVGVVPMTCGLGVISGFSRTLAHIAAFLGFKVLLSDQTDAAGMAEVVEGGARILLTSDDDCYMALNFEERRVIHNSPATGRGFAFGLNAMAGGLAEKPVLVIGCGPVGQAAVDALLDIGAKVSINDLNETKLIDICARTGSRMAEDLESALMEHRYLIDATTAAGIIEARHLDENTYVAAPGVPCGIENGAMIQHEERIIHDPLQIGTAVMLLAAISGPDD